VKPRTATKYRRELADYILPALGDRDFETITRSDVQGDLFDVPPRLREPALDRRQAQIHRRGDLIRSASARPALRWRRCARRSRT
jgi:hypothetical protein